MKRWNAVFVVTSRVKRTIGLAVEQDGTNGPVRWERWQLVGETFKQIDDNSILLEPKRLYVFGLSRSEEQPWTPATCRLRHKIAIESEAFAMNGGPGDQTETSIETDIEEVIEEDPWPPGFKGVVIEL